LLGSPRGTRLLGCATRAFVLAFQSASAPLQCCCCCWRLTRKFARTPVAVPGPLGAQIHPRSAVDRHAYIGRAARFLRNRFQKRLVEPKAESPIDSEVRMVPLVPPEDGLLPIPPAQMPHVADPAAFLPLQSPELQPVGKPSAFDPLMQLYDDIVEGFKASLKNKELSRRYPRDVFLSSSHLRNCRPLSSCPIASEGDFDVVGFMEVDNRPFLRAVEAAGLGGKLDKPPENKRISTRSGSSSSSGIFSFKRDEQPSLQRLPVTRLRCGGEY